MPKNIVVYSDGTGQDGGARPEQRISNIYKMYRISRDHAETGIDPSRQVVFYDAGLGTDIGATALTAPVRFVQKLLGSVTGAGIKRNIADCYEFIVNHYEAGRPDLPVRLQPRRLHGPQPREPPDALRRTDEDARRPADAIPQGRQGHRLGGRRHRARTRRRTSAGRVRGRTSRTGQTLPAQVRLRRRLRFECRAVLHRRVRHRRRPGRQRAALLRHPGRPRRRRRGRGVRRRIPPGGADRTSVFLVVRRRLHADRLHRAGRHHRRRARRLLVLAEQVDDQDDRRLPEARRSRVRTRPCGRARTSIVC